MLFRLNTLIIWSSHIIWRLSLGSCRLLALMYCHSSFTTWGRLQVSFLMSCCKGNDRCMSLLKGLFCDGSRLTLSFLGAFWILGLFLDARGAFSIWANCCANAWSARCAASSASIAVGSSLIFFIGGSECSVFMLIEASIGVFGLDVFFGFAIGSSLILDSIEFSIPWLDSCLMDVLSCLASIRGCVSSLCFLSKISANTTLIFAFCASRSKSCHCWCSLRYARQSLMDTLFSSETGRERRCDSNDIVFYGKCWEVETEIAAAGWRSYLAHHKLETSNETIKGEDQ